jgi:type III secretory pathway component EscR
MISIDKQTNELVAVRSDRVKVPESIKGVTLDEQQKKDLSEGKAVWIENMTSKKNTPFSAYLQFNADKRGFEFRFDNEIKQSQTRTQNRGQGETNEVRIPKKLLGADLTEKQQNDLKAGQTVYVSGMTDKAGQDFNAYVKVNTEKNKLDFFKYNPDKAKKQGAEVTPGNAHKTQVAVNSDFYTGTAMRLPGHWDIWYSWPGP